MVLSLRLWQENHIKKKKRERMMLGGSWIPPVTKPKSETLSRKLLAFWWFCKKSILQGGHRRKVRRLHRSFWDKWELAGTGSRATRKQIPEERNSILGYPLWERRATFVKQLVRQHKVCKMQKPLFLIQAQRKPFQKRKSKLLSLIDFSVQKESKDV